MLRYTVYEVVSQSQLYRQQSVQDIRYAQTINVTCDNVLDGTPEAVEKMTRLME